MGYMRKYGVVEVARDVYRQDERRLTDAELENTVVDERGVVRKPSEVASKTSSRRPAGW